MRSTARPSNTIRYVNIKQSRRQAANMQRGGAQRGHSSLDYQQCQVSPSMFSVFPITPNAKLSMAEGRLGNKRSDQAARRPQPACGCGCFCSFLEATNIPGLNYLRAESSWPQRGFWLAALATLAILYCELARSQLQRWLRSPVIVAMTPSPYLVSQLPMPALIICPSTANVDERLFNITDASERLAGRPPPLTPREEEVYSDLSILCWKAENINVSNKLLENIDKHAVKNFSFQANPTRRSMMYFGVFSREGGCNVHNALYPSQLWTPEHKGSKILNPNSPYSTWTLDNGYAKGYTGDEYPLRARGPGKNMGMLYKVYFDHLGKACRERRSSVQVFVHNPSVSPAAGITTIPVSPHEAVYLALSAHVVHTEPALRDWYSPRQRLCYFSDERRLRFFRIYTQMNCEMECQANLTWRRCGCVPFFWPHVPGTKLCRVRDSDSKCVAESLAEMSEASVLEECNCLSECMQLSYTTDVSKEPFNDVEDEQSLIMLYFTERYISRYVRTELFGTVELIANLGGLLGLCLGVSLMSVAELVFWLLHLLHRCGAWVWACARPRAAALRNALRQERRASERPAF